MSDVYVNFWGKQKPKFTEMELALMEGGHSLQKEEKFSFLKTLNETTFGGQDVEGNALVKFKEKFPNLSTLMYFIPGFGQALMAADMVSQVQMYNQAITKIEQQYPPKTIQTIQQQVGDADEEWETL
jgi:hypothetical protein